MNDFVVKGMIKGWYSGGMKNTLYIVIIVLVVIGAGYWWWGAQPAVLVTNFEECVAAGNPVMESYPRQCRHGGQTYVEDIEPIENGNIPTSADNAPEGSIHNLPMPEAVAAVRRTVANELGVGEGVVIVMTAFEREWPDDCLGLADAGEICTVVITPGYEVTVQAQGSERAYRTNNDGSVLRREE